MTWLIPGIVATMTLTLLISLIYFYLWYEEREKFLLLWGISWWAYSLRFATHLMILLKIFPREWIIAQNGVTVISGIFIVWGTYVFQDQHFNKKWLFASAAVIVWTVIAEVGRFSFFYADLPNSLFVGGIYAWTGLMMLRFKKITGIGGKVAGSSLILWGIHKADYTFLRPVAGFAPWGFLIASMLFLCSAIGVLLAYYEKIKKELKDEIRIRDSVEKSLENSIAQRQQVLDALSESEKKFRSLFENLYDIYYRTDSNGIVTLISPSAERFMGYRPDELIGHCMKDFFADPHDQEVLLRMLADDGFVTNFISQFKCKDNSLIWLSTNAKLVRDENGNCAGEEGIKRDVTQLKRIEEEKKKLEAQLIQLHKMEAIGTLAGGIAHDFNNILSAVLGYTELVLEDIQKGTLLERNLQQVYSAGKRAKDLVRQILAFARQSDEAITPIRVDLIAKEALQLIRASIPTTIDIRQNILSQSMILGNSTQVHQLFMNLCTNAAHAMQENGGVLEIGVTDVCVEGADGVSGSELKPGDYLMITVSDTGIGMTPAVMASIFEPYFTTKNVGEGTGMGLAMVHGIVVSYGGSITVDSKLGAGTVFTIYLPVTDQRVADHAIESETLLSGTERILLVDDELPIVLMGRQTLGRLGYKVVTRTSSLDALALFRADPGAFDLVITDMTMPNMTGDRLAKELIAIRPEIPVILCTGISKTMSDASAAAIGIKAFANKPIVKMDLAKVVRRVLDGRSK